MISCQEFFDFLKEKDFLFFTGIPDSTFKEWIKFVIDSDGINLKHMIACNECEAIALAAGYHLATNKIGVVYMQNSGLGKAINPLTSLCDPEVYSIPLLLMVGWRGEPGKEDAPQHKRMGKITTSLLKTLSIPYSIIEPNISQVKAEFNKAEQYFKEHSGPYAFILRKNIFEEYKSKLKHVTDYTITREGAIRIIMDKLNDDDIVVSTTGYTSRELFEYRESRKGDHHKSFYNIGSMGCASSIGLSVALEHPNKRIVVFDGDGSVIMQMGALTTIGKYHPSNLLHIIFDNQAHESTGGQPTNSKFIDFITIALASNYKSAIIVNNQKQLDEALSKTLTMEGPTMVLIKIKQESRKNLKRPNKEPKEYKEDLIRFLTKN